MINILIEGKRITAKEVANHPGYYLDSMGNLYSFWINKGMHGLILGDKPKKLKGSKSKTGHISIRFHRNENPVYIHRLMIETFIGDIPEGMVVCHRNDDPLDNRLENLYVGTQKDNMDDCKINGKRPFGEKSGSSKITEEQAKFIISQKGKRNRKELSKMFGIGVKNIWRIQSGTTWSHLQNEKKVNEN